MAQPDPTQPKKIALVVGSGGIQCAAALGLWKVLKREQIPIDLYVGCSGGSLFTALMALDYDLDYCTEKTIHLWDRRLTKKRHWPSILRAVMPGVFGFNEFFGMVNDTAMLRVLRDEFGERSFAETAAPLYIVATDFHTGEPAVLSEGGLVDALRASISVPFIWKPWKIGERVYVDGMVSNPMPVDVAILEGADIILAMGFDLPFPRRMKSPTRFVFHLNSLMSNNLLRANFAFHNLAHHAEILTILPNFETRVSLFNTDQIPHIISQGEKAMEEQLDYLQRLLRT